MDEGRSQPTAVLRFVYLGESLRNGRVCKLATDGLDEAHPVVTGAKLLEALLLLQR